MSILLRSKRPAEAPDSVATEPESSRTPRGGTIGDLLRQTRESYGQSLDEAAATLCIRASLLGAIEEGRYDRLPAQVYALGFVRAYAQHLGLDGDEAVRRYKQETAGRQSQRDLSFPAPLAERSIPGGRMLLIALVLAICGYGLWYYVSSGSRERPVRVAEVPADLMPPPPAAPQPAAEATPPTGDAAIAPTDANPAAPTETASAPAAPAAGAPATPPATIPSAATIPPAPATPAAPAGAAPASSPTAPAVAQAPDNAPAVAAPPAEPAPAAAPTGAPPPPPAPGAASPATPVSAPAGRVFGEQSGPVHIVIRATADSWLQVRDGDENLVAQRLLHAGDTYRVPDKPGLVMRTGNGSGLDITVDGRPAPRLGGAIRRNVALDPAKLLAGTAAE